jgi:predicted permease
MGGALGLLVAFEGVALLKRVLPQDIPRLDAVQVDWRVVAFACASSIGCALLAGLLPAWQEARGSLMTVMKQGGAGSIGAGRQRLRSALVVGQVAFSMTLLVCAALLAHSLLRLNGVPLGFRPERATGMTTAFAWDTPAIKIRKFSTDVMTRLATMPGVSEVGVVDRLPLQGGAQAAPVAIRGRHLDGDLASQSVSYRAASAGYFRAIGVPLLSGSLYPDQVDADGQRLAVVTQRFAKRYFPHGNVVGQLIQMRPATGEAEDKNWIRITGVIGDIRVELREANPMPEVYQAWGQAQWPLVAFVVRTAGDPRSVAASMRSAAAQADPNQPILTVQPLTSLLTETTAAPRLQTALVSGFAGAALLLAAVGLYGLLTGDVVRRTREFGVRIALGASPGELLRNALGRGMRLIGVGLVLGFVGSFAASRFLQTMLYEVKPGDLSAAGAAGVVLGSVGLAACWFPARRAARVSPTVALRQE